MKHLFSVILCVCIAAIGAGLIYAVLVLRPEDANATTNDDDRKALNVRVAVLKPTTIDDVLLLTGRIEPWEEVMLSAEVSGRIDWQGVEEGDPVSKGQELVRIDTVWYEAAHRQAIAQNKLAQQELERVKGLRQGGVSSPQEFDRAVAQQRVAAEDVNAATTQLNKAVLYAPMDGIVDTLTKEPDEWADRGEPLLRLVQTAKVKAVIGIPERDVVHFKVEDPVAVTLDALPGRDFEGRIYLMATSADVTTRTFQTEIELDNADGSLKPGMTIRARLVRETYPDAIAVPIFSILSMENQRFVAVEEDGLARVRSIQVGVLQGNQVHVTEGLSAGDRLIVTGQRDLRDGAPVNVTDEVTR